jgi:two-component system, OmpR family, sensor histidine kinase KdpD
MKPAVTDRSQTYSRWQWSSDGKSDENPRQDSSRGVSKKGAQVRPGRMSENVLRSVHRRDGSPLSQYLKAAGTVFLVALANFFVCPLVGVHATALIFLLAIVVLALFVERGPALLAAALSALVWDYFFLPPVFAFRVSHFEDLMLLGMYFVVALALGQLTSRIRMQQETERQREERAGALYMLTRELSEASSLDQMVHRAIRQTKRAFKAEVAVLLEGWSPRKTLQLHPAGSLDVSGEEERAAAWVLEHGQPAGRFTDHCPVAEALYVPLMTSGRMAGVMGLRFTQSTPPTFRERDLLNAFVQQIALAIDRHRLNELSEKSKLLAESERLSKTLLNSMSHEIRTPLAAIKSATGNLVEFQEDSLSQPQREMIAEIQEATERLNRLVGNVLEISRLESGHVKPRLHWCDVRDLVHVAVKETRKELAAHKLGVEIAADLPLVRMDFVLMLQALTNLLSNAAFHTPAGTEVVIGARIENETLLFTVADRGPGIPPEAIHRIFDKFYRAPAARAGGTGLGLGLVKGFVEAQGGETRVENRTDGGAVFTIRLPARQRAFIPAVTNP